MNKWQLHGGRDGTVIMRPGETPDTASIQICTEDALGSFRLARLIAGLPELIDSLEIFMDPFAPPTVRLIVEKRLKDTIDRAKEVL